MTPNQVNGGQIFMTFIKKGVPVDLQLVDICPKCKKPKTECVCEPRKDLLTEDQTNGVHQESDNNRKLLHRGSN